MGGDRGRGWRWSNVPIPEPHAIGLVGTVALQAVRPWRLTRRRRGVRVVGAVLVAVGVLLVGWAVRTVGERRLEEPTALVVDGPYAFTRNPMYVGWTALYAGVGLLANSVWAFVLLPAVVAAGHGIVLREERSLERAFGDEYRAYRRDVRRYR